MLEIKVKGPPAGQGKVSAFMDMTEEYVSRHTREQLNDDGSSTTTVVACIIMMALYITYKIIGAHI